MVAVKTLKNDPWHCPKCGELLILKEGRYGRFMACPKYPDCRYAKAMWTYQNVKPYCIKCKGTGLLPFEKNGKVIAGVSIYCECYQEDPDHYRPVIPSDYDYPISYDYYRSLCQYHGWNDPGSDRVFEIEDRPQIVEHIHRTSNKELIDKLHKTQVLFNDLENRLNLHIDNSKKGRTSKYD